MSLFRSLWVWITGGSRRFLGVVFLRWCFQKPKSSQFILNFVFADHDDCMDFSKHLRRIVRTFDRAGESRLSVVYVLTSHHNKRFVSSTVVCYILLRLRAVSIVLQVQRGECTRARAAGPRDARNKGGSLSCLAPSVTCVVIFGSRAFCSAD